MASALVTAFFPEEWTDFIGLLDFLVPEGTSLFRWDEWRHGDGSRLRAASIIRSQDGPEIDAIGSHARKQARFLGFKSVAFEQGHHRTNLEHPDGRLLRIGFHPLPPQVVIDVHEASAPPFDLTTLPAVAVMLELASRAGTTDLQKMHRHAELDLDRERTFFPPTTELEVAGPYDRTVLCNVLRETGFSEEGDVWTRAADVFRAEIRVGASIGLVLTPSTRP